MDLGTFTQTGHSVSPKSAIWATDKFPLPQSTEAHWHSTVEVAIQINILGLERHLDENLREG